MVSITSRKSALRFCIATPDRQVIILPQALAVYLFLPVDTVQGGRIRPFGQHGKALDGLKLVNQLTPLLRIQHLMHLGLRLN